MGNPPADDLNALDAEIGVLRRRTEELLGELESRVDGARRGVTRVKDGLSRARELATRPAAAAGVSAGTVALAGLGLWLLLARRADSRRLVKRVQRRAGDYGALLAHPERALGPRGPSLRRRLVTAVLIAAATTLTRRLLTRKMR